MSELVEVHSTYIHSIGSPEKEVSALLKEYKNFEGPLTLFNPNNFQAELVDLPDGGHHLVISSSSEVEKQ